MNESPPLQRTSASRRRGRRGCFTSLENRNDGLPHDPFTAIVGPRPIGWITSMSSKGEVNLAPYSFFNSVSSHRPMVMFASDGPEGHDHLCRGNRRIRLQSRSLGFARSGERNLVDLPLRCERDGSGRPRSRSFAASQAAAHQGDALRPGMQMATDGQARRRRWQAGPALHRFRPSHRRTHRRALYQGRPARHRRDEADLARRLS